MPAARSRTPPLAAAAAAAAFASLAALAPRALHADAPIFYAGRWLLTEYWIADEQFAPHERASIGVRTRDGDLLAYAGRHFYDALCMEGTGRTWDGRLLNWDARVHGRACFVDVDREAYPYGVGVAGYALVPYRSLAVDRRFIPIGHTVDLPELMGMPLPDGSLHDGCFVAVDGGGAINGHHIDLFLPNGDAYRDLGRAGYLPDHIQHVIVDSARCASARAFAVLPVPR